jgi:hypothetical protein
MRRCITLFETKSVALFYSAAFFLGSPGMSGAKQEPFTVYAIGSDSKAELYMIF